MPSSSTVYRELARALNSAVTRVGSFFDIFDLSFFVAGFFTLGAADMHLRVLGVYPLEMYESGAAITAIILVSSYCMGLICFAVGRTVRRRVLRKSAHRQFPEDFRRVAAAHGLSAGRLFRQYPNHDTAGGDELQALAENLYTRVWVEVREYARVEASFNLARRYWVLNAIYDGLAAAVMAWALIPVTWSVSLAGVDEPVLGWVLQSDLSSVFRFTLPLFAVSAGLAVAGFCFREAQRYSSYQLREVLAVLAHMENERVARLPDLDDGDDEGPHRPVWADRLPEVEEEEAMAEASDPERAEAPNLGRAIDEPME